MGGVKSFLRRDGRILVSDGEHVARVRAVGSRVHPTGRSGVRLDLTPDLYDENHARNRAIYDAQSVWMAREERPANDLPSAYWRNQVDIGYDWNLDIPAPSVGKVEGGRPTQTSIWERATMGLLSSAYAVTSVARSSMAKRKRHWFQPLILGAIVSYDAWAYGDGNGLMSAAAT